VRPLFCRGIGPFRWVALSGDPEDIRKTDARMKALFPHHAGLHRWLDMAQQRIAFQGLPARIFWIGLGQRHLAGLAFNDMVKNGELKGPIVIGRDHLDSGSVASPTFAARRLQAMISNTAHILGIELLAAAQGIEFLRPLKSSHALEQAHAMLRQPISAIDQDRFLAPDMEHATRLVRNGALSRIFRTLGGLPKLWVAI